MTTHRVSRALLARNIIFLRSFTTRLTSWGRVRFWIKELEISVYWKRGRRERDMLTFSCVPPYAFVPLDNQWNSVLTLFLLETVKKVLSLFLLAVTGTVFFHCSSWQSKERCSYIVPFWQPVELFSSNFYSHWNIIFAIFHCQSLEKKCLFPGSHRRMFVHC
jgi:hypothetical protein